jgi:biopolymer transport protein ExbB
MNIVEPIKQSLLAVGASPVMWLMLGLSIASVAVILERAWLFIRIHANVDALSRELRDRLRVGDLLGAQSALKQSDSAEALIVRAGLDELSHGPNAVREAMAGATLLQRNRLERGLNYLGTLASNAPFVGLFGTVIGIILAFEELGASGAKGSASAAVMGSIAEALVATAVGIGVAVPAVVAFNAYQKRIRVIIDQATALGHVLLAHVEGQYDGVRAPTRLHEVASGSHRDLLDEATNALLVQTGVQTGVQTKRRGA